MVKTTWIGALILVAAGHAWAATPFADVSFDEACRQAGKESKVVLVDFYTTWCGPCKRMDEDTWPDAGVIKLLGAKAVAIRVDAEKQKELAAKYRIEAYPTTLITKADGSEVDRLVGFRDPKQFVTEFEAALAGKDAVARAREAVGDGRDPATRQRLGSALADKQDYAGALNEYLWCFDHGVEAKPGYAGIRSSFLLSELVALGKKYPPAREALEKRRDAWEAQALAGTLDDRGVRILIALNTRMGQVKRNVDLFDRLPKDSKFRAVLRGSIVEALLAAKRYPDVLEGEEPLRAFDEEAKRMAATIAQVDEKMKKEMEPFMRKQLVRWGAYYVEALAGVKRTDEAAALAEKILKYDATAETRTELAAKADRAGDAALARRVRGE